MIEPPSSRLAQAYAHCDTLMREGDRDRWLACFFAPADLRPHLHALYAFSLEVARIRDLVSDPMPGEIRYQWWRDVLEGEGRGDIEAHPVAHALLDTIERFRLPRQALSNLIDARTFDLYDDPMPGLRQLEGYCAETASALFRVASLVLSKGASNGGSDIAAHGGVAYAITGLLRALPWHAARSQVYIPLEVLARHGSSREEVVRGTASPGLRAALAELRGIARARLDQALALIGEARPETRVAYLPLTLVRPNLRGWRAGDTSRSVRWSRSRNGASNGSCGARRGLCPPANPLPLSAMFRGRPARGG